MTLEINLRKKKLNNLVKFQRIHLQRIILIIKKLLIII